MAKFSRHFSVLSHSYHSYLLSPLRKLEQECCKPTMWNGDHGFHYFFPSVDLNSIASKVIYATVVPFFLQCIERPIKHTCTLTFFISSVFECFNWFSILVQGGDYIGAVLNRNNAENISRVLYPNDNVSWVMNDIYYNLTNNPPTAFGTGQYVNQSESLP
jgi:hypothetical protein